MKPEDVINKTETCCNQKKKRNNLKIALKHKAFFFCFSSFKKNKEKTI